MLAESDYLYFGVGAVADVTVKSKTLKGCTWIINTDSEHTNGAIPVKPNEVRLGKTAQAILKYEIYKIKSTGIDKNGLIWKDREYLIKNGYCPFSLFNEGDTYDLTRLASYAGWYNDNTKGGVYLNISKSSGHDSKVEVAVSDIQKSDGSSNLNVTDKGPVYEGDISNVEPYLPKNQLFYFAQMRVVTEDNGITIPFPMYSKENYFWRNRDHHRHRDENGSVQALVGTRKSDWIAKKSFLGQYKDRIKSGATIVIEQIGAGIALAVSAAALIAGVAAFSATVIAGLISAGSLMAAGGLIGVAIVAAVAICALIS